MYLRAGRSWLHFKLTRLQSRKTLPEPNQTGADYILLTCSICAWLHRDWECVYFRDTLAKQIEDINKRIRGGRDTLFPPLRSWQQQQATSQPGVVGDIATVPMQPESENDVLFELYFADEEREYMRTQLFPSTSKKDMSVLQRFINKQLSTKPTEILQAIKETQHDDHDEEHDSDNDDGVNHRAGNNNKDGTAALLQQVDTCDCVVDLVSQTFSLRQLQQMMDQCDSNITVSTTSAGTSSKMAASFGSQPVAEDRSADVTMMASSPTTSAATISNLLTDRMVKSGAVSGKAQPQASGPAKTQNDIFEDVLDGIGEDDDMYDHDDEDNDSEGQQVDNEIDSDDDNGSDEDADKGFPVPQSTQAQTLDKHVSIRRSVANASLEAVVVGKTAVLSISGSATAVTASALTTTVNGAECTDSDDDDGGPALGNSQPSSSNPVSRIPASMEPAAAKASSSASASSFPSAVASGGKSTSMNGASSLTSSSSSLSSSSASASAVRSNNYHTGHTNGAMHTAHTQNFKFRELQRTSHVDVDSDEDPEFVLPLIRHVS
jgi:hypothetical protein